MENLRLKPIHTIGTTFSLGHHPSSKERTLTVTLWEADDDSDVPEDKSDTLEEEPVESEGESPEPSDESVELEDSSVVPDDELFESDEGLLEEEDLDAPVSTLATMVGWEIIFVTVEAIENGIVVWR